MVKCPYCEKRENQVKDGLNGSGSQRYRCKNCQRHYTPEPHEQGYTQAVRQRAVELYLEGMNFRRIARHLKVNHQTVINWVNAHAGSVPTTPPLPDKTPNIVELDEVFTFVGNKKTKP